jgi:hypothetical protein
LPSNANSGQGDLFRAYLKSRIAFWALVAGVAASFVIGAVKHALPVMVGGPVVTAILVAGVAFFMADHVAAERFYQSFAGELGLAYSGRRILPALTPLLGAGDRRHADHWMEGTFAGDLPLQGGLGHFTWEELESERDKNGVLREEVKERHTATICGVGLDQSLSRFRGIYLRPRQGLLGLGDNWLPKSLTRKIEVESAAFTERYELRIADDMDEMHARQLLSPTLVSWLAEHPLTPGFELKAGTLVVYTMRELQDSGNLTFLIDATRHLAGRVLRELREGGQEVAPARPSRALAR